MIVSMYGRCDNFDVVYTKVGDGLWRTKVPADLSDGKYVVDIYGIDSTGYIVYWTGILYMYDSRVVKLELLQESNVVFYTLTDDVCIFDSSDTIEVLHPSFTILCEGGVYHDVQWCTEY